MTLSRRATKDDYDSSVRFLRDFRKGSLRSSLDVVMEETESTSSSRSPPKIFKAKTCACLSSLMRNLSSQTLVSNEDDKSRSVSSSTDQDAWGFFVDDNREANCVMTIEKRTVHFLHATTVALWYKTEAKLQRFE